MGAVRHPLHAALLPVRRHGEPVSHLRHADAARRRAPPKNIPTQEEPRPRIVRLRNSPVQGWSVPK
eukprot:scaffold4998_cov120-Isochrysis_galbana.AAC.1